MQHARMSRLIALLLSPDGALVAWLIATLQFVCALFVAYLAARMLRATSRTDHAGPPSLAGLEDLAIGFEAWHRSPLPSVVISPDGVITAANESFASALATTSQALKGVPFIRLVHPDDRKRTLAAWTASEAALAVRGDLRPGKHEGFENNYMRADGGICRLKWRTAQRQIIQDLGELVAYAEVIH